MSKQRKAACPLCGGQLLFCVKTTSRLCRKINKNGELSKIVHQGNHQITDIYYLECDEYRCDFLYNISYPEDNEIEYAELDDWYEEFGENFRTIQ